MNREQFEQEVIEAASTVTSTDPRSWASPVFMVIEDTEEFIPGIEWSYEVLRESAEGWLPERTDVTQRTRREYARRIQAVVDALRERELASH